MSGCYVKVRFGRQKIYDGPVLISCSEFSTPLRHIMFNSSSKIQESIRVLLLRLFEEIAT